jgi:hypothetical protein
MAWFRWFRERHPEEWSNTLPRRDLAAAIEIAAHKDATKDVAATTEAANAQLKSSWSETVSPLSYT